MPDLTGSGRIAAGALGIILQIQSLVQSLSANPETIGGQGLPALSNEVQYNPFRIVSY